MAVFGLVVVGSAGAFALNAGLEFERRGGGHGRALLQALLGTPQGKKTWVVRIPRGSRYAASGRRMHAPRSHAPSRPRAWQRSRR